MNGFFENLLKNFDFVHSVWSGAKYKNYLNLRSLWFQFQCLTVRDILLAFVEVDSPDELVHCENIQIFNNQMQYKPIAKFFNEGQGIRIQDILNCASLQRSPTLEIN